MIDPAEIRRWTSQQLRTRAAYEEAKQPRTLAATAEAARRAQERREAKAETETRSTP